MQRPALIAAFLTAVLIAAVGILGILTSTPARAHMDLVCDERRSVMVHIRNTYGEIKRSHSSPFTGGLAEFWWVYDDGDKHLKILVITTTTAIGTKSCFVTDGLSGQ